MTIVVDSRRRSAASINHDHPDALVLDVTSGGSEPWVACSPFYPHGGIPVPFSPGVTSQTVEGIWQALKVFKTADVDPSRLRISSMKGIKRTVRSNGPVLGHRKGLQGTGLLSYVEARRRIYLPSYKWVLRHKVSELVDELRRLSRERDVVLLDVTVNGDVDDESAPLSHAALLRYEVEGLWPD